MPLEDNIERIINIMANASLHAAKDTKNDEFYTRLEDINEELKSLMMTKI